MPETQSHFCLSTQGLCNNNVVATSWSQRLERVRRAEIVMAQMQDFCAFAREGDRLDKEGVCDPAKVLRVDRGCVSVERVADLVEQFQCILGWAQAFVPLLNGAPEIGITLRYQALIIAAISAHGRAQSRWR